MKRFDFKYAHILSSLLFMLFSCFHLHAQELITNGDFETGDLTGWTSSSTGDQILVVNDGSYISSTSCFDFLNASNSQPPITGNYSLLFDMFGSGTNEVSTTVTLPSNLANLIFSFDVEYGREENVSAVEIELLDNSSMLIEKIYTSFDNAAETQLPAQRISLNLTNTLANYSGQNISIRIFINMGEACIPAQIDNVSLNNTVDYAWKNGQDAFLVIGQRNFFEGDSNTGSGTSMSGSGTSMSGSGTSMSLNLPNDIAIDPVNNKMYVSDQFNDRILRYSYPPDSNQPAAEVVLGQDDFISTSNNVISANKISAPAGLCVDNLGNLWVADNGTNRVLRFNDAANKANGAAADGVLGQPDFESSSGTSTSATSLSGPNDVFVDKNGTLWVSDRINSRILRFDNAANKANGAAADGVLGQPDFTTGSGGTTANKMTEPSSVFVDDKGALWVADRENHRVLRFDDAANKTNGAAADGVLGQTNFTSDLIGLSGAKFFRPQGLTGDAQGNIYVSDANHRVLTFKNVSNDLSVSTATYVLGQVNLGTSELNTTPNGMRLTNQTGSQQIYFDPKEELLWVADDVNSRVLGFDPRSGSADYFVKQDGNDASNGQSWSTAFATLQKAIESAQAGQTIWVAGGTYYPSKEKDGTTDESRKFTFYFDKDLHIYGGFSGEENALCERDIACNPTILSGDLGTLGVNTDNCFHVVESTNLTDNFLLDGFTIQDGNANDGMGIEVLGGGWLNDADGGISNPGVSNCTFFNNIAREGAGMYNDGRNFGETMPTYVNCKFIGNILISSMGTLARGGGVFINAGLDGVTNSRFENCIFSANGQIDGDSNGGGIYISAFFGGSSNVQIRNCSFTNNETTSGRAIGVNATNGSLNVDIQNSILWNNGVDQIDNNGNDATITLSYSIFDDGNIGSLNLPSGITNGGNNSDEDPLFSDADGSDNIIGTLDDDLRPSALSPAYNTGLDSIINTTRDIAGKLRIIGNRVDRGAYELELVCQPIFVDADATTGSNNGSSWENAFLDLNDAVNAVSSCGTKVIWVAEGTYLPITTDLDSRQSRFEFTEDTEIYGGFNGTENSLAERDLSAAYETILSGDIGVLDVKTDNAYTITFVQANFFIMDGFTIAEGFHDQAFNVGGGMTIYSSSASSTPEYNKITIRNCRFEENRSIKGGAILSDESSTERLQVSLINCVFINNEGLEGGGAIYMRGDEGSQTINIINSSFTNNVHTGTTGDGDVIWIENRKLGTSSLGTACVNIDNSIIWNDGTTIFNQTDANTRTDICISNSILKDDVEDGTVIYPVGVLDGGNNLDADPIFLRAGIGDLRVAKCSPALDVGNNLLTADVDRDLVGSKRIFNSIVDLGAYEWEGEVTSLEVSFLVEADSLVQGVDSIFTTNTVEVVADDNIVFEAAEVIILTAGFHAQVGSEFTARIDGCTTENNRQIPAQEVVTDDETEFLESRDAPISTRLSSQVSELQVQAHPNPFTGQTNIKYYLPESGAADVFITDLNGKVRYQQQMSNVQAGWQQLLLDASDWNSGMYLLFIRTKDTQVVQQLVVQQ